MDCCSLEELVILQYGSFSTLSQQEQQLAQRTGHSKCPTEWPMRWQLYLDKLNQRHLGWSMAQRQNLGLFLLEWLFYTTSVRGRRVQQCDRWRHPHQATSAEEISPHTTLSVGPAGLLKWGHLGGGQGHLPWPGPAGTKHLHSPTPGPLNVGSPWRAGPMACDGWPSQCYALRKIPSRGRACSQAPPQDPSLSQAQSPSPQTSRHEGTTAPQQHGCSTVCSSWAQSTGPTQLGAPPPSPKGQRESPCQLTVKTWM